MRMYFDASLFPIFAADVLDYFIQSNFAGQVIVIFLLLLSVAVWGIVFCKNSDQSSTLEENRHTHKVLSKSATLVEAAGNASLRGPNAQLLHDAVAEWARSGYGLDNTPESRAIRMGHVDNALQRCLARQIMKCESKMTVLGTIISGAPFLGLLGTAWGVMDCFGSMSAQASVTLQDLAPGVAGALLTTVAGLIVAIPAVFGYNYLSTRTRTIITDMENFASLISDRIELESRLKDFTEQKTSEAKFAQPTPPTLQSNIQSQPERVIKFTLDEELDNPAVPNRDYDD